MAVNTSIAPKIQHNETHKTSRYNFETITLTTLGIYQKEKGFSSRNGLRDKGESRYRHVYHGILKKPRDEAVAVVEASRSLYRKSAF